MVRWMKSVWLYLFCYHFLNSDTICWVSIWLILRRYITSHDILHRGFMVSLLWIWTLLGINLTFLVQVMGCCRFYTEAMEACWVASILHQHGQSCVWLHWPLMDLKNHQCHWAVSFHQYVNFCRITSSGLVFMIVHSGHTGNFVPNILSAGLKKRFCCDSYNSRKL